MVQLASEMRKLVYTIICFQCLLQLTAGSAYQKYLKLFSQLLVLSVCCSVVLGFFGFVDESLEKTDILCNKWTKEWERISEEQKIYDNSSYLENKILDETFRLYENEKEADNDVTGSEAAME